MSEHKPVLLSEVIKNLDPQESDVVVDLTLGRAGHASEILARIPKGHLYAFDQDKTALEEADEVLRQVGKNYTLIHANFKDVHQELAKRGVSKVDLIYADLGVSSPQFDEGERGFSYRYDAPLDMRMDQEKNQLTAQIIVNTYSESELRRIFYAYSEHPFSGKIAHQIVTERLQNPLVTTGDLVKIIKDALPAKILAKKGHPAKTIFQALRIATNDELGVLTKVLEELPSLVNEGGKIAFITFHSLEDRLVKQAFKTLTSPLPNLHPLAIRTKEDEAKFIALTRKPIIASREELALNPRAASAKLRIITKRRNV